MHKKKRIQLRDDAIEISRKYRIHFGESETILLAKEIGADLVLMNEKDGRNTALSEGLHVKGTIGVLIDCLNNKLLKKNDVIEILKKFQDNPTIFWISPKIIESTMSLVNEKFSRDKNENLHSCSLLYPLCGWK